MADQTGTNKPRTIPKEKTQVNFNIPRDLLRKVEFISFTEQLYNSDIYVAAIEKYVDEYEKKNGKIKTRTK
jgi:hypothetical protein